MRFVSFQPSEWRTCDRYRRYETERLGFPPMYCSLAETELMAAVNVCLAIVSVPETALFFKTNDWFLIPTDFQEQYVNGFTDGYHPGYLSRRHAMEWFKPIEGAFDDVLRDEMPYGCEFLVDPKAITPVAEIDVKNAATAFIDGCENKDDFLASVDRALLEKRELFLSSWQDGDMSHRTESEVVRMADAYFWYDVYVMNDVFINDYRRIFGSASTDSGRLSMHGCFDSRFHKYHDAFMIHPSEKTLHKCASYLEKKFKGNKE